MRQLLYEAKSVDKPSYDQRTEQEAFAETDQMAITFRKAALEWKRAEWKNLTKSD